LTPERNVWDDEERRGLRRANAVVGIVDTVRKKISTSKKGSALRRAFLLVGVHFFDKFTLGELKWPLLLMPNLASLAAPVLTPARAARSKSKTSPSSTTLAPVAALASTLARPARSPSSNFREIDRVDVRRRG
jgi:hypothetical protein